MYLRMDSSINRNEVKFQENMDLSKNVLLICQLRQHGMIELTTDINLLMKYWQ